MNLTILALSLLSMRLIGEDISRKEILLLHRAYYLLHLESAGVCFGISACLRSGSSIGIGLAAMMYFLNLIANMTDRARFLKYITPLRILRGCGYHCPGRAERRICRGRNPVRPHRYRGGLLAIHQGRYSLICPAAGGNVQHSVPAKRAVPGGASAVPLRHLDIHENKGISLAVSGCGFNRCFRRLI